MEADGQQYRRNRRELIKTEEDTPACTEGKEENTEKKRKTIHIQKTQTKRKTELVTERMNLTEIQILENRFNS